MVNFDPTPEQEALRDMAHKFAANEIRPRAAEFRFASFCKTEPGAGSDVGGSSSVSRSR